MQRKEQTTDTCKNKEGRYKTVRLYGTLSIKLMKG